jgi:putative flippase GtrA
MCSYHAQNGSSGFPLRTEMTTYPCSLSRRRLLRQGVRFVLTGAINTGFSYCIYAACIFAGAGYALASAASLVGGILFSYKTMSRLVFHPSSDGSLQRYIACYGLVYGFNLLLLKTLDSFGIDPYVCGLIAAVPTAVISFVLLKLLVFRAQGGAKDGPVDRHTGL